MTTPRLPTVAHAATALAALGRRFYDRGWVLGTSGNFSAVVSRRPLRLAITASSVHKGTLSRRQILEIDDRARVRPASAGRSSAETLLHLEILKLRDAGAILHTHSVWSTILSDLHASTGGLAIQGFEMLKGLDGVTTHEHREWIPVVENDQDMPRLAANVRRVLGDHPSAHAFLIRRHGLYTWGRTIADAERHVEILEFLFEVIGKENGHGFGENSNRGSDDSRRR
jgi:methylthioribulose-1-phosphate dehydratase